MRNLFRTNYYDAVLNIFTSFGYFESDSENNKIIRSIAGALKKEGWFILDFMNVDKEIQELVPAETVECNGVKFSIKRFTGNGFFVKEISVSDKEKAQVFREQVKVYRQKELEKFLTDNQLDVVHLFGDYNLNPFNTRTSERLILIGRKK